MGCMAHCPLPLFLAKSVGLILRWVEVEYGASFLSLYLLRVLNAIFAYCVLRIPCFYAPPSLLSPLSSLLSPLSSLLSPPPPSSLLSPPPSSLPPLSSSLSLSQYEEMAVGRRSWEEDYVLKQAFPALVPAFDPRPGRSNISQIQNFEVPPPGTYLYIVCALDALVH